MAHSFSVFFSSFPSIQHVCSDTRINHVPFLTSALHSMLSENPRRPLDTYFLNSGMHPLQAKSKSERSTLALLSSVLALFVAGRGTPISLRYRANLEDGSSLAVQRSPLKINISYQYINQATLYPIWNLIYLSGKQRSSFQHISTRIYHHITTLNFRSHKWFQIFS